MEVKEKNYGHAACQDNDLRIPDRCADRRRRESMDADHEI